MVRPQAKQASKQERVAKAAVPALGAAGLSFGLVGGAFASATPTADVPQKLNFAPTQTATLGEEEMADVSLATFHLFERENVGSAIQLARGCGCGRGCGGCGHGCGGCGHGGFGGCGHGGFVGCRGCGGFRGCLGFRGCGCGGCGFGGCGYGDFGFGDAFWFGNFSTACCQSWGRCRLC